MTTICLKVFLILWTYVGFSQGSGIDAILKSLVVTSDIKVRYARTLVSAEYLNDKNSPAIADFQVTLPDRAYISNFSMEINGNLSVGQVKEKEEAKKTFDEAVKQGQSAGYVSVKHRHANVFNMRVNIEPNNKVVFNLTYEELLRRTNKRYRHRIFLPNKEIIDKLFVEVFISEPQRIKIFEEDVHKTVSVRSLEYIDNKHVYIKFDPTKEEQKEMIKAGDNGEFVVVYDVHRKDANVLYTLDGYFVHFYAPDAMPKWPKYVVIMIDVSGSMGGDKLKQVKFALRKILQTLDTYRDTFILGTFAVDVEWRHIWNIEEAMDFVDSLKASGGTDMNKAMLESLDRFNKRPHSVNILFFLTDGEPTSGVTDKEEIRLNIKNANRENVLIFPFGFGDDCDLEFLKYIASENGGFSQKIYDAQDSGNQIINLFKRISDLVLKNVMVTYLNTTIDTRYLTSTAFNTIFSGSEIAIAGRIKNTVHNGGIIVLQISGESPSGMWIKTQSLGFANDLDFIFTPEVPKFPNLTRFEMLPDISKKTWAYVTLKQMIEENAPRDDIITLAIEEVQKFPDLTMFEMLPRITKKKKTSAYVTLKQMIEHNAPRDDIITLAIENGFVTAYTSMVVTKENFRWDSPEEVKKTPNLPVRITTTLPPTTTTTTAPPWQGHFRVAIPVFNVHRSIVQTYHPIVPHLYEIPAVIVKPYKCDQMLCVTQDMVCANVTKLLLLRDIRANVEIYSYPLENDNCMRDFKKITIQTQRKHIEVTPSVAIINGKRINMTNRSLTRLKFNNFLQLNVFFNRERTQPTVSVQFIVLNEMHKAAGLYSQYMKSFDCIIHSKEKLTLSHMRREFNKVTFHALEEGLNSCYK